MAFNKPDKIVEMAIGAGVQKSRLPLQSILMLGFLAGAFISLGYLLSIRITANLPAEWGSLADLIGASIFPVGLILVVLAGGELITGNMMTVPLAFYARKISLNDVLHNWFWVTIANFIGALFVAYFFGHLVGLTETGPYLDKTVAIAEAKVHYSFEKTLISAIGCNWLVALAIWLSFGSDDFTGKIIGIWFPVMAFVAIGFQHVVANMFVIPAAIFAGHLNWFDYIQNFIPAFIGNAIGGSVFVGLAYFIAYTKKETKEVRMKKAS